MLSSLFLLVAVASLVIGGAFLVADEPPLLSLEGDLLLKAEEEEAAA